MSKLEAFKDKMSKRRNERIQLLVEDFKEETTENAKNQDLTVLKELETENKIINYLNDPLIDLPVNTRSLIELFNSVADSSSSTIKSINSALIRLSFQKLITLDYTFDDEFSIETEDLNMTLNVVSLDQAKIEIYVDKLKNVNKRKSNEEENIQMKKNKSSDRKKKEVVPKCRETIESLLLQPTALEKEERLVHDEIEQLLSAPTAKDKLLLEKYKSVKNHVQEFCQYGTKDDCYNSSYTRFLHYKIQSMRREKCNKIHFKRIIKGHTDQSLGDCSFLNTCFHMDVCKYIHYEIDLEDVRNDDFQEPIVAQKSIATHDKTSILRPPQWVQTDLRTFDMSVLGKFSIIMADPPWDIHMELPYGTMEDDEMRKLNIPSLQENGYIFLWVTGRAMELGRECLKIWGYERCDEIIWVKTNQLQRIIRTGRTGHWLNHGKEHCLVGVKGKINDSFNRGLDCDIIVSEVRATSHKPDEIYGLIERLSPGTRKVELFGRPHNVYPNWITLGNELDGVRLFEPDLVQRFKSRYPNGITKENTENKVQAKTSSQSSNNNNNIVLSNNTA